MPTSVGESRYVLSFPQKPDLRLSIGISSTIYSRPVRKRNQSETFRTLDTRNRTRPCGYAKPAPGSRLPSSTRSTPPPFKVHTRLSDRSTFSDLSLKSRLGQK